MEVDEICSICLNNTTKNECNLVTNIIKEMLGVILLKLSVDQDESNNIICENCYTKLFAAVKFKSECLYTENKIVPFLESESSVIDLKSMYVKEQNENNKTVSTEDFIVCRLCMEPIREKFVPFQEIETDLIDRYIPEINFNFAKDPLICKTCLNSLETHSRFVKDCKEKMQNSSCDEMVHTKLEPFSEIDIKYEPLDVKSEYETDESVQPTWSRINKKFYQCALCTYKTKYRINMKKHMVTHDSSKSKQCEVCSCILTNQHEYSIHKLTHTDALMYTCPHCDYKVSKFQQLSKHVFCHNDLVAPAQQIKKEEETYTETEHELDSVS